MKKLLSLSKIVLSVALITATVTIAHAWTAPTQPATGGNVPAPINTGSVPQTKNANLSIIGNLNAWRGFFSQVVNSPKARFGCFLLTCGSTTLTSSNIFEAGTYDGSGNLSSGLTSSTTGVVSVKNNPLFVNLMGMTGSQGRNALQVLVDNGNLTNTAGAVLMTNSDKFSLFNSAGTDRVSLAVKNADISGGIKISGAGTPGPNKILTSVDSTGIGMWMDPAAPAQQGASVNVPNIGDVKVIRRTFKNDGNTQIHDAYATCDSGYIAISGGVDCESAGGLGRHDVSISEPAQGSAHYPYGSGTGNGTTSNVAPTGWHGACTDRLSNNSSLDMHVMVVCMKTTPVVGVAGNTGGSSGGSAGTGGGTSAPATAWHPVPNTVGDSAIVQSCQAWLAGNSSIPNTFVGSNASNYGTVLMDADGNYLGFGTPTNPVSTTCAYKAVVGNITYCDGILAVNPTTSINGISGFKPVKTCTGRVPLGTGWGQANDITVSTYIKY